MRDIGNASVSIVASLPQERRKKFTHALARSDPLFVEPGQSLQTEARADTVVCRAW